MKRVTITDLRKGSTISSKSKRSTSTTKAKKAPIELPPQKEELSKQKPKELYEIEAAGKTAMISPERTTDKDKKKAGKGSKKKEELTIDEKMRQTLPVPTVDEKAKERAAKVEARFRKLILELVEQAVGYGESLKLSREI